MPACEEQEQSPDMPDRELRLPIMDAVERSGFWGLPLRSARPRSVFGMVRGVEKRSRQKIGGIVER